MRRRPAGVNSAIFMLFAAWAGAGALGGCGGDDVVTELRVVVDSDLQVPGELAAIRATVTPTDEREPTAHEFALDGADAEALPLSFSVVPHRGDASRDVELLIEGLARGGAVVVARGVRTGFLRGKRLSLPILLQRTCVDRPCNGGESCISGRCVDAAIDPRSLEQIARGQDPRPTQLDGADQGADAGAAGDGDATGGDGDALAAGDGDATGGDGDALGGGDGDAMAGDGDAMAGDGDAAPMELACAADCSCEAGTGCTVDAVGADAVVVTCEPGSACEVDGRRSRRLMVHCEAGASCDVDCTASTSCMLDCPDAACRLGCGDANNCRLEQCPAEPETCPDGTLVCGLDC